MCIGILVGLFSIINTVYGRIYPRCYHYKTLDNRIYNDFCQWCNISDHKHNSSITNMTQYKCMPYSKCLDNNNCITNNKHNNVCLILNIFANFVLIFILMYSIIYISTVSSMIIKKHINNNRVDGITTRNSDVRYLTALINLLLFGPLLIFWVLGKFLFVYYFLFIMLMVIFVSCTAQLKKTKESKSGYSAIN